MPDCKLATLADYFGAPVQPSHRALADARATATVLWHLLGRLADREVYTLGELAAWLAEKDAEAAAARTGVAAVTARRWPLGVARAPRARTPQWLAGPRRWLARVPRLPWRRGRGIR